MEINTTLGKFLRWYLDDFTTEFDKLEILPLSWNGLVNGKQTTPEDWKLIFKYNYNDEIKLTQNYERFMQRIVQVENTIEWQGNILKITSLNKWGYHNNGYSDCGKDPIEKFEELA